MTDRNHTRRKCLRGLLMGALVGITGVVSVDAAVVGYWRFEGGTAGSDIVTAVSEVNSSTMNATQNGSNAIPVQYGIDMQIRTIYDPALNSYSSNYGSMLSPNVFPSTTGISSLVAANSQGSILTTTPGDWTYETFIKIVDVNGGAATIGDYTSIASVSGDDRWTPMVAANSGNGRGRFRVITSDANSADVTNYSANLADGRWHHLAYTTDYDSGANETTINVFVDYGTPVTTTAGGQFEPFASSDFFFGRLGASDAEHDWLFDEVRLSTGILPKSEFLRAYLVPEPSTCLLVVVGAFTIMACRRIRKKQPEPVPGSMV